MIKGDSVFSYVHPISFLLYKIIQLGIIKIIFDIILTNMLILLKYNYFNKFNY